MNERMEEGYFTQRPPMFDGKFYTYWKNRMKIFIEAENYQVQRVTEIGDFEVTTTNSNNEIIPKPITEYEKEDFQKIEMNALAIKLLHYGLGPNEHNRIMGCKSVNQIWDLLEVTHKGTSEVKGSKIDFLMSKYERSQWNQEKASKRYLQGSLTSQMNLSLLEDIFPLMNKSGKL